MKPNDFQALLLRAAVVAMAADGDIAEEEKQELANIASSTAYFLGFDHVGTLSTLLADKDNLNAEAINRLINTVASAKLSDHQEPVLLDILLRVIEADNVVMPAERELLRLLRPVLHLSDGVIFGRHPRLLGYLMSNSDELDFQS